ncbi:hypothetical protein LV779_05900 [Streptomyces thinghirensis]|nr:hypothetical protein [Streptomyces thinghirensis]
MESILDWYKEEGMIFKRRLGRRPEPSRIRSSKELLSSGGNASGPVSFMRGADASAGTIVRWRHPPGREDGHLDVDHPDIEDFIQTKVSEEEKIRALRDAGFRHGPGRRRHHVRPVPERQQLGPRERHVHEGRPGRRQVRPDVPHDRRGHEEVEAKSLFRKMAEAAWACADPGIQYDDIINHWHTCPESGRINGSNPCSEYMHLDNTSRNLAC